MPYNKRLLSEYFAKVLANTTVDGSAYSKLELGVILGGAGSGIRVGDFVGRVADDQPPTIYISVDGCRAEKHFIDECSNDREFQTLIGDDAIQKQIRHVLKQHWNNRTSLDIDNVIRNDILQSLRDQIKTWSVRVPVKNLIIGKPFTVGSVMFTPLPEGIVANATLAITFPFKESDDTTSQRSTILELFSDISKEGSAWAVATIRSHEARIVDVATAQVELAISAVRAFTHVFYPYPTHVEFGLPNELGVGRTSIVATTEGRFSIQNSFKSLPAPFELTDKVLDHLREEFSFDDLSRVAAMDWTQLNTLQQSIRVALLWLSRSVIARTIPEAFLNCAIAIERLVVVDNEQATAENFAERLALLLTEEKEVRKEIYAVAKRLYNIRSKVVHAGLSTVDILQLRDIEDLALQSIAAVSRQLNVLPNHAALRDLLHDKKMQ